VIVVAYTPTANRGIDALADHPHRDQPRVAPGGEAGDARRRRPVVAGDDRRVDAEAPPHHLGDAPGVLLVGGDDQAAGIGVDGPDGVEAFVGAAQHGGHPLAVERQGSAQALRRAGGVEGVVEAGRDLLAAGRHPLHVPADAGEVHRPHDAPVAQGVAVPVGVVGPRLVELVADERDR
jgi:hypothetical protein